MQLHRLQQLQQPYLACKAFGIELPFRNCRSFRNKTPALSRWRDRDRPAICLCCPFSGHGFSAARSLECLAAHLQLFADLHLQHLRYLQHFWQNTAYMRGLWHKIAVLPLPQLPPFVPIFPSGMDDLDDISDDSHILILIILITFLTYHRIFLSTINYQTLTFPISLSTKS
ncbi:MAG: hypothetical protein JNM70_10575 [Anaerolineae bacterium]|nr:hypothetical protein [Anaerolineae bacterium]